MFDRTEKWGLPRWLQDGLGVNNGMKNVRVSNIRTDWCKCDLCGRYNRETDWYHGPVCGNIVSITARNAVGCEDLGWNVCEDCAEKLRNALECSLEKFNEFKREKELLPELKRTAEELGEGFIAVANNLIIITYQGAPTQGVLEIIKCRVQTAISKSYAYIVDVRDINTKIWELNKKADEEQEV